ncbi:MAG: hypothetical protein J2P17_19090, partial [Mycobacterium sp.]|nr:hypothetical protein [Mycobacterium sp.]
AAASGHATRERAISGNEGSSDFFHGGNGGSGNPFGIFSSLVSGFGGPFTNLRSSATSLLHPARSTKQPGLDKGTLSASASGMTAAGGFGDMLGGIGGDAGGPAAVGGPGGLGPAASPLAGPGDQISNLVADSKRETVTPPGPTGPEESQREQMSPMPPMGGMGGMGGANQEHERTRSDSLKSTQHLDEAVGEIERGIRPVVD